MNVIIIMSWVLFASTILLLMIKVWHVYDAQLDWKAAQELSSPGVPSYEAAHGGVALSLLQVVYGLLWVALGAVSVLSSHMVILPPDSHMLPGLTRAIMTLIVWIELAKFLNDRVTRTRIIYGIERHYYRHHRKGDEK